MWRFPAPARCAAVSIFILSEFVRLRMFFSAKKQSRIGQLLKWPSIKWAVQLANSF